MQLRWLTYFLVCIWHRAAQLNQLFQSFLLLNQPFRPFLPAAIQVVNKWASTGQQSFHFRPTKRFYAVLSSLGSPRSSLPPLVAATISLNVIAETSNVTDYKQASLTHCSFAGPKYFSFYLQFPIVKGNLFSQKLTIF